MGNQALVAQAERCLREREIRDGTFDRDGTIDELGRVALTAYVSDASLEMPPRQDADKVDSRDIDSPDRWVKRHQAMVRLTGRHPFNSEPPLKELQAAGWITPPSLHVVRNHGAVPQLPWQSHKLQCTGTPNEAHLSMDELTSGRCGEVVTIPVTFICAGNRRKEQNMTKKTIGFNWGSGAVGNSVWTGVRLCDLLAHLGVTKPSAKHRYVHFQGPEGELPQGRNGSYGTSIDIGWALDRERDVLLAFKQNGEFLAPDHGAPLRTLLPGCIGGRMVKWLCKMWVSSTPSDNHYHYYDNRVLPPHVDAQIATEQGWWHKPEYIINSMNINSAMFEPRHNSVFRLADPKNKTMRIAGYAYSGGGNKIIRAEISLDKGETWEIANLTSPEEEIAKARGTGKYWCWSWWETEVEAQRLIQCEEICCRAVDSNQSMQPAYLTWNVMGMMNNCLFRVKVHPMFTDEGVAVWFEHPTQPGAETGGWMTEDAGRFDPEKASDAAPGPRGEAPERPAAAYWSHAAGEPRGPGVAPPAAAEAAAAPVQAAKAAPGEAEPAGKLVTSTPAWLQEGVPEEEVEQHGDGKSAWIVVKDRVYDCTPYLKSHPGGASSILLAAGADATEDFGAVHSKKAWTMLEDYFIGRLKASSGQQSAPPAAAAPAAAAALDANSPDACFLSPKKFQALPLVERIEVSHDTRIFRFGLPSPSMKLGLPTGMHIFLKAAWKGEVVMRPYTPMTDNETVGHVDFLIKVYFANVHPKFPDGGKMSQALDALNIGDTVDFKGPLGEFIYDAPSHFSWHGAPNSCARINMIAGGTGLTPCWQVANAVLRNAEDMTQVRLVYANQTPDDILAREQLDALAAAHPGRFKIWYTVDRLPNEGMSLEWPFDVGFVGEAMLREHLFEPGDGTITVMCGPPPMLKFACVPNLEKIGHKDGTIFSF